MTTILDRPNLKGSVPSYQQRTARQTFETFIEAMEFPCVGAKSALARNMLHTYCARSLTSAWDDVAIHEALFQWSRAYAENPEGLRSFAVLFQGPGNLSEEEFEHALWTRVQSLADKDAWRGQDYSEAVSNDPDDPHFSLSFGGKAYFVVGLHPEASRKARRLPFPALVFNLHDQFETLREEGRYERMRERILERDKEFSGSINPMLARHGEASEARQYSGRAVGDDWQCPFSDPRRADG